MIASQLTVEFILQGWNAGLKYLSQSKNSAQNIPIPPKIFTHLKYFSFTKLSIPEIY
jgi:hypothetical protein